MPRAPRTLIETTRIFKQSDDRARLARRRFRRPLRRHARLGMAPVARRRHRLGIEALLRDHLSRAIRMAITRFSFPTDDPLRPRRAQARRRAPRRARPEAAAGRHRQGPGRAAAARRARRPTSPAPASTSAVFGGVFGNPTASQAMAGAAAYRAHRADCVVGIGGGAALDVAKVVGADRARTAATSLEYAWDHPQVRADRRRRCRTSSPCRRPPAPAARSAAARVISEDDTHVKRIVFSPQHPRQGRVRRPRADARPAAGGDRGDRHGRADAQRRELPVAGLPPALRRHRARGRAHRRARARHGGARARQPRRRAPT